VRIEDLDTPRVVPGSAQDILKTLATLNLLWDGDIVYQSTRLPLYRAALERLREQARTFECSCSRQAVAAQAQTGYPGTCRDGPGSPGPTATRFRSGTGSIGFTDRIQGECTLDLDLLGDVVIRRRDGLFAYQLSVVVDDADQGVTDVVRGADLLESTGWQLQLQQALNLRQPRYAHLPVVTAPEGGKLAKARCSMPPDLSNPGQVLVQALVLLRQQPPIELTGLGPGEVLEWAILNWNPARLHQITAVPAL
jgi:glutamyl-Q tRNA(Asp) synthetase